MGELRLFVSFCLLFSDKGRERASERILTLNGSKDVELRSAEYCYLTVCGGDPRFSYCRRLRLDSFRHCQSINQSINLFVPKALRDNSKSEIVASRLHEQDEQGSR